MPILAGWLTGEQVAPEIIEQTLAVMGEVLGRNGGEPARIVQPGAGLITFTEPAYAMQNNDEPPILDWVPDRRTLVYRRPLSGIHPLYYIENWPAEGNLLFASELKALLAVGAPRRLHLAALDALLRYGFIPAPWTAFQDISIVPAGSILRWQRAKTVVNHSTDYHFEETPSGDPLEELHALLNETTAGLFPPHEHLIALTDGSCASALTAIFASQHSSVQFSIASLGYKKSTLSKVWREAEQVAIACQRPFLAITGVDQPEFWAATLAELEAPCVNTRPLAFHELLHTVSTETGARIALTALGSNVLLGPVSQLALPKEPSEPQDILHWYRQAIPGNMTQAPSPLWSKDVAASLQNEKSWEQTLHALKLARQAEKFADKAQAWYYLDLHLRLPDLVVHTPYQLAVQERMAIRSPYLHPHVIEMLTGLPTTAENGTTRSSLMTTLLQNYIPEYAAAQSLLQLNGPIASLSRIADSDLLQQTLSPEAIQTIGIFDPQEVEKLLHKKGKGQREHELLFVFTTQLLYHLFQASL